MDKVICNGLFTPESQQEAVPEKDAGQQPPYYYSIGPSYR